MGVAVVGGVDHEVECFQVLFTFFAIAPVIGGQFPVLQWVVCAIVESTELFLVGDVQPELDDSDVGVEQHALEFDDFSGRSLDRLFVDDGLGPFYQEPSVPGTIEDRHLTNAGQNLLEPPEEVVAELFFGRRTDRHDPDLARVDARRETTNGPSLTRGVEAFEDHDQSRSDDVATQEARRKESELSETALRTSHAFLGYVLTKRLG